MKIRDNLGIIIFGASGDLAFRKLLPALFNLYVNNHLPENYFILGTGRKEYSDLSYQEIVFKKLEGSNNDLTKKEKLKQFIRNLFYVSIQTSIKEDYTKLEEKLIKLKKYINEQDNYIFYFATPPALYPKIAENLSYYNLNNQKTGWKRLIVEKPFGTNLESARELNKSLLENYDENQIYRIDHYLGKETVQNILVTRFSNVIYEPVWNRNYIHHVEISAAESIGIGNRGGYYDNSGALRDMVQNHLLQLLALVAMEPPVNIDSKAIRNEIVKVFQSIRPYSSKDLINKVIRGQYIESTVRGEKRPGYRQESGVDPNSRTETYVALKLYIDNWRWSGVPFYIRTGKCLPTRVTEVVIHFKHTPHHLFCNEKTLTNNVDQLIIRIQPDEGILMKFGMKVPGAGFKVQTVDMDFHYKDLSNNRLPDAYERLLLDCMQGDSTLYARGDAVEESWKFITPILKSWENNKDYTIFGYPSGSWGPKNADSLIEGNNVTWRYPCKNLSNDGTFCEL